MRKNLGLLAILAVVIVVVAVSGCNNNNTANGTNVSAKSTKLAIMNNGDTWMQIELVANVTHKNGTNMTVYVENYIKPKENVTVDLSQMLGYGDEPLPAGTTIRVQSWKGLFNETNGVGEEGTLDFDFQGWSNTLYPTDKDQKTPVTFNPVPIFKLPAEINESVSFIATTEEELAKIAGYDTAEQEPVYEEEIITVNADGTVTITITKPPELCRAIASLV